MFAERFLPLDLGPHNPNKVRNSWTSDQKTRARALTLSFNSVDDLRNDSCPSAPSLPSLDGRPCPFRSLWLEEGWAGSRKLHL